MPISKTAIKSTGAPAPPPFLSQAIQMGDFLFCSGQVGCRPDTGAMVEGSIQDRTVRFILPTLKGFELNTILILL
jgi:enamine deaminase RidA (YjgF/YER057c/UK114 family)